MKVYATISEEIEISLTGNYRAGFAGSYEEPPEGDIVEDDDIESICLSRRVNGHMQAFDILAGLDAAAKRAIIQNVSDALGYDVVQQALLENAE